MERTPQQIVEFNWDWPEPLEDYGVGDYYWVGDDWKRANEIQVLPSYEQETFNNGMDLLLFRMGPIALIFLIIWVVSFYV